MIGPMTKREEALMEALEWIELLVDGKEDADLDGEDYIPNDAMRILQTIDEARARFKAIP